MSMDKHGGAFYRNTREDGEFGDGATVSDKPIPTGQVSADDIREMLDGLEGVTPGPWRSDGQGNVHCQIEEIPPEFLEPGERPYEGRVLIYDEGTVTPETGNHLARCDPDTMRQVLTLALDALTRRSSSAVKVKALEWEKFGNGLYYGKSLLGTYAVSDGYMEARLSGKVIGKPKSLNEGKEMCQQHLSDAILSALETPSPSPDAGSHEPVAWVPVSLDGRVFWNDISTVEKDLDQWLFDGFKVKPLFFPSPEVPPQGQPSVLRELEAACEALAATRSQETYLSMVEHDKATDALARLDRARAAAREALTPSIIPEPSDAEVERELVELAETASEHLKLKWSTPSKIDGIVYQMVPVEWLRSVADLTAALAAKRVERQSREAEIFVHATPKPDACKHDFQGWREFDDGRGGEQVCTKCGIGAMAYTLSLGDLP